VRAWRRRLAVAVAGASGAAVLGAAVLLAASFGGNGGSTAAWQEVRWPFPGDPWGTGLAFRCTPAACGGDTVLYVRAKLGFCNCATGVADDVDLDRMSDFELLGSEASSLSDGRPVAIGALKGRYRAYALIAGDRPGRTALSVALNERCDMIVATAILAPGASDDVDADVLAFLGSPRIQRFVEEKLGL
jgi:hypothetical protein